MRDKKTKLENKLVKRNTEQTASSNPIEAHMCSLFVACHGQVVDCTVLELWWLIQLAVGSNPGHDTFFFLWPRFFTLITFFHPGVYMGTYEGRGLECHLGHTLPGS